MILHRLFFFFFCVVTRQRTKLSGCFISFVFCAYEKKKNRNTEKGGEEEKFWNSSQLFHMVSEGWISACTVAILLTDYRIYWQGLHQLPITSFNAVPKGEGIPHVILAERDYRKPEFLLPQPLLFFPRLCLASLGTLKTSHKPSPQINWDILFYPCNVENARGHIQIAGAYSTALIILKKKKKNPGFRAGRGGQIPTSCYSCE